MKPRYILPAILTLAASTIASAADSSPAYNFLNIPSSARVYGLGGINISSIDDDINSIDQNPALLGPEFEMQVGVNYMRYISDANFAGVKFGTKASEHGAWAVGLQYYGYGEITGTDETGTLTGNFSPKDVNFNGHHRPAAWRYRLENALQFLWRILCIRRGHRPRHQLLRPRPGSIVIRGDRQSWWTSETF